MPIIVLIFLSALLHASPPVIYGEDNRLDLYEVLNPRLKALVRSTAAMVQANYLSESGSGFALLAPTLKARQKLCSDEKFVDQITVGYCSGFLIGKRTMVTAGHCMDSESKCSDFKWVFDYQLKSPGQTSFNVPESSVYSCARIISQKEDSTGADFAVIELNRDVSDREPLAYRSSGKLNPKDELAVIGHPDGLPTKVAQGGKVRSVSKEFFTASLDTFHVNSGSAVFNLRTYRVEGILVRGEDDYVVDEKAQCRRVKVCKEDECRGEDVMKITEVEMD
jgi:hypothetical protein